ncbi:Membrane proteins related to metalloendopeptidases [uncultured Synechococcales cyanobacterium]|uniref:Membrane proteins related to metalloendopeptidases n=1 Tax=uncultured Synechococcales cyanobacterium TaxID=1936017 RepID=A0A6J4VSL0_9CYAN|nr:Membrane proteins related to metalloendopeptidases [uncultured Synechococcales cyanobacterium]
MSAFVLSCCLIFWARPFGLLAQAAPPTVENLQQIQQKVEQYRTGVAKQQQHLQKIKGAAQRRLEGLRRNIDIATTQIESNEAQIAAATAQLQQLETDLVTTQKAHQQKQSATVARLRFLQRRRTTSGWAALLQSQTLEQFLDRRHQLKLVYQADQRVLASLKAEANKINTQKQQVEFKKNEIALLTQQLSAQRSEFEEQAQVQAKLVKRLSTDRQALAAAEVQLATDSENIGLVIQQRLNQRQDANTVVVYGTGRMSFPSNGPITSVFGWRMHPVLGSNRFHSGMDFGAEYGSPIRAADRGTVIFAGWYGGYGNAVIIDHGNAIITLYGHSSQLYVVEGQVVKRGQAIAAVGSTGLSTGPHLHFEVRYNGEPIDPGAYL